MTLGTGQDCNDQILRVGYGYSFSPGFFAEETCFTMDNDLLIGVTRSFRSFSQALDEVKNARIFAGTPGSPAMTVKPLATKSPTGFSTRRCFPLIER
jgi:hypothetical protein